MPAEFLWKEYQADAREADRKYWGKAVEISGKPSSADSQDTGSPSKSYLLFAQSEKFGVRANLLDDDAAEILKEVATGQRIRLKCFCAGTRWACGLEELRQRLKRAQSAIQRLEAGSAAWAQSPPLEWFRNASKTKGGEVVKPPRLSVFQVSGPLSPEPQSLALTT